jgi:hypothetical protein
MRMLVLAGAALLLAVAPAAAQNKPMLAVDAQTVASILQENGLETEIGTDSYGDPMVTVTPTKALRAAGMRVIFYDCDGQGMCNSLAFVSYYLGSPGLETINTWNQERRWTKVYVAGDGDSVLEMDVNAEGGIGQDSLRILAGHYLEAMPLFGERFGS